MTDRVWLVHADTGRPFNGMDTRWSAKTVTFNLPEPKYDVGVHIGQLRVFDPSCGGLVDRKKYWVLAFDGWPQHPQYSSLVWNKKVEKGQYNINKTLQLKNVPEDRAIRINTLRKLSMP